MADHGYGLYSRGCRCDTCKAAKADYMRQRRADARAIAQKHTESPSGKRPTKGSAFAAGATRHLASVREHGTRYAYDEAGCRCRECTSARMASDRRYKKE